MILKWFNGVTAWVLLAYNIGSFNLTTLFAVEMAYTIVFSSSAVSAFPWSVFAKVNYIQYEGHDLAHAAAAPEGAESGDRGGRAPVEGHDLVNRRFDHQTSTARIQKDFVLYLSGISSPAFVNILYQHLVQSNIQDVI